MNTLEKCKLNDLSSHHKKLEKKNKLSPKVGRRGEIISRNQWDRKQTIDKNQQSKCFSTIDKQINQEEKEWKQINNIRDEEEESRKIFKG